MTKENNSRSIWEQKLDKRWENLWSRHWDSHWSAILESLSDGSHSHSKTFIFNEFDVPPSIYSPNYYTYRQDLMAERMDKWLITEFTQDIHQDIDQLVDNQNLSRQLNQYWYHYWKHYWFEYWYTFYAK
uniref:hypothetical protein n=1 Tax=Drosera capensis TaxID=4366 RepID=UPI0024114779|nr:hypothetical protein P8577_pgp082 [Drosera capensis]WEQ03441.1 hypothetical protein [Drosera capensis]